MAILFDIIASVLILACAVSSLKNGFMATLIKKTAPLISAIAAFSGAKGMAPKFTKIADKIVPTLQKVIQMTSYHIRTRMSRI